MEAVNSLIDLASMTDSERKRRRGQEIVERWKKRKLEDEAAVADDRVYEFEWRWTCRVCGFSEIGVGYGAWLQISRLAEEPDMPPCEHTCPKAPDLAELDRSPSLTTLFCPPGDDLSSIGSADTVKQRIVKKGGTFYRVTKDFDGDELWDTRFPDGTPEHVDEIITDSESESAKVFPECGACADGDSSVTRVHWCDKTEDERKKEILAQN